MENSIYLTCNLPEMAAVNWDWPETYLVVPCKTKIESNSPLIISVDIGRNKMVISERYWAYILNTSAP